MTPDVGTPVVGTPVVGPPVTIGVVVAFHDRRAYLADAVRSVLAERARRPDVTFDLVLVDDGSTDGSAEIAAGFGGAVRVVRQENRGCAAAWNTGLAAATGDWFTFCDSDDLWVPGRTDALLAPFAADPTLEVAFGRVDEFVSPELDGATLPVREPRRDAAAPISGAILARRSALARVGSFDDSLRQGYWIDWYARLRDEGVVVTQVPEVVLHRRLHSTNSSVVQRADMGEWARALQASLARRRAAP